MLSGADWWRSIEALFGRKHGCRRRSSSVRLSLERSFLCESLRGELPFVWRCPSGWSVFGGCVDPRCVIEDLSKDFLSASAVRTLSGSGVAAAWFFFQVLALEFGSSIGVGCSRGLGVVFGCE